MMDGSKGGKSLPHQGNLLPRCQGWSWGAGQQGLKPFKLKKELNKGCGDMFHPLGCDIRHVHCHYGFMSQSVCSKGSMKKKTTQHIWSAEFLGLNWLRHMLCAELFNPASTRTCRATTGAAQGEFSESKYGTRCLYWLQSYPVPHHPPHDMSSVCW